MTNEHVAETLRQAVRNGIVVGWKPLSDGTWLINPQTGPCKARTADDVREYCRTLNAAGIKPCTGLIAEPSPQSPSSDTSSSTPS